MPADDTVLPEATWGEIALSDYCDKGARRPSGGIDTSFEVKKQVGRGQKTREGVLVGVAWLGARGACRSSGFGSREGFLTGRLTLCFHVSIPGNRTVAYTSFFLVSLWISLGFHDLFLIALTKNMSSNELIDAQFDRAVEIVQGLPKTGPIQTDYEEKLTMYRCVSSGGTCMNIHLILLALRTVYISKVPTYVMPSYSVSKVRL